MRTDELWNGVVWRIVVLSGLFVCVLLGCSRPMVVKEESIVFGTRVSIQVEGVPLLQAQQAIHAVFTDYWHLHVLLHPWDKAGALMHLNNHFAQGLSTQVTPEFCHILQDVQALAEDTHHLFNPAIGDMVAAWGFFISGTHMNAVRYARLADVVAHHPTMRDVLIHPLPGKAGCIISSTNPFVRIDLSGYAKGLALDRGAVILKQHGIEHALINAGGNVMAIGRHADGRLWAVGLRDPRHNQVFALLSLYPGEAVGTSGDYYHFVYWHGRRYGHILDPRTGYPVQDMMSVTVLVRPSDARWSSVGVLSDVFSKPLFVAGPLHFQQELAVLGFPLALAFDGEHHLLLSDGMMKRLRVLPSPVPLSQVASPV